MGAPAGGESYDVEVLWTLHRAGEEKTRTVRVAGVTDPQLLDCPFAWDGRIEMARWVATARLTWRGHTWVEAHHSRVLFPPVQAWRVVVYNESDRISLEQALVGEAGLQWTARYPDATALVNLNRPFLLRLGAEHGVRLQAGERLAAYLATTVESPEEREATLLVRTRTPLEVYVNGEPVELGPQEEELSFYPFEAHQTAPFCLREGENTLLLHTHADPEGEAAWYVAGTLGEISPSR